MPSTVVHQEYQTFGVHELKIKVSHRVWVTQQSSMLTSLGVVVRGVAGGQGAVGWLQYRHMPTILQLLIYIKCFFSYGKINNIF